MISDEVPYSRAEGTCTAGKSIHERSPGHVRDIGIFQFATRGGKG